MGLKYRGSSGAEGYQGYRPGREAFGVGEDPAGSMMVRQFKGSDVVLARYGWQMPVGNFGGFPKAVQSLLAQGLLVGPQVLAYLGLLEIELLLRRPGHPLCASPVQVPSYLSHALVR